MGKREVFILKSCCRHLCLGMIMKHKEHDTPVERKVSTGISFFFMFLVGMSMPHFIGVNFAETHAGTHSVTGSQEMMSWGMILFHVVIVSLLSNIGKALSDVLLS